MYGIILFYIALFLLILLFLFLLGCNVNGVSGDGTSMEKGTCPETYQVCASNGVCEGIKYYHCQSQNKVHCYFSYFIIPNSKIKLHFI